MWTHSIVGPGLCFEMSEVAHLSDRAKVELLETEMRKHEQRVIPIRHYFLPGFTRGRLRSAADTLLTGRVHLYEQLNILSGR